MVIGTRRREDWHRHCILVDPDFIQGRGRKEILLYRQAFGRRCVALAITKYSALLLWFFCCRADLVAWLSCREERNIYLYLVDIYESMNEWMVV